MNFKLTQKDGKYFLNGTPYSELSAEERVLFNQALKDLKLEDTVKKHVKDPNFDKPISELNTDFKS